MRAFLLLALAAVLPQDPATLTGHTREVWSLAVSADGKWLASGSTDLTVRLWDLSSKSLATTFEGHDGAINALAFSPDGKYLASGEMYKKVKLWDLASKKEVKMFPGAEGAIKALVFSSDGKRLFGGSVDNTVHIWDVASGAEVKKLVQNYEVVGLAISKDGKWLASADGSGGIKVWDSAGKEVKSLKHADKATSIGFSPDGKLLASGGGDAVKLWDTADWSEKGSAKADANALAFSPDGSTLVVGTQDNFVFLLSGTDLEVKGKFEKHERPVTSVAVNPNGKAFYTGSQDYGVKVWALP